MSTILKLQGLATDKGASTDGVAVSTESIACGNSSASVAC